MDPIDDELLEIDMNRPPSPPPITPPRQIRPLNSPTLQRRRRQGPVPMDLGPPIQIPFLLQRQMTQEEYNQLLALFPEVDITACGYDECPIMYSDLKPHRTVRLSDNKCYSFKGIAGLNPNDNNLRSPMNNTPLEQADKDKIRNLKRIIDYETQNGIVFPEEVGGKRRKRNSSRRKRKSKRTKRKMLRTKKNGKGKRKTVKRNK